jgi:transposase-like protein
VQKVRIRNRPGRPTKKTEDRAVIILRALENGATRRAAAAIGGIDEATFYRWVAEKPEFCKAVEQAQSRFIEKVGQIVQKHPASAVKWAMMLQRADPQLQPVQERVEVTSGSTLEFVCIDAELGDTKEEAEVQPSQNPVDSTG